MNSPSLFIHIDADAFFASVEQCIHKELKGKPVVTGRDGSIVVAMSYEAKALGIERGIPTYLLTQQYPQVYMVASDYQMYKVFSDRMIAIVSQHLPTIQRTSVDECKGYFSNSVTSFDVAQKIAQEIKERLETKLGCTFSIGVARTPLLAKIASAMEKPSGLTVVNTPSEYDQLCSLSIGNVPGFGRRMAPKLQGMGIATIRQFITRYPQVASNFSISMEKIYQELIQHVTVQKNTKPVQSMNRARSFQATANYEEILGQLSLNTEYLLRKLRHQHLMTQTVYVTLRDKERNSYTQHRKLLHATYSYDDIYEQCVQLLQKIYQPHTKYRYVSVTIGALTSCDFTQPDLFGASGIQESNNHMWKIIDETNTKLGAAHIQTATSLLQPKALGSSLSQKNMNPHHIHRHPLLPKETAWRRLQYPYLGTIS